MYENYIITKEGSIISKTTGKQIYIFVNKKGYNFVRLSTDGRGRTHLVHRIIASVFIDNPDDKPQVNHIDGNKSNNHYLNLEWCTNLENNNHASNLGLHKRGKERPNAKLTNEQVLELRKLRSEGYTYYELGDKFNISYQSAHKASARITYPHV